MAKDLFSSDTRSLLPSQKETAVSDSSYNGRLSFQKALEDYYAEDRD
jgi:hypothetical protein